MITSRRIPLVKKGSLALHGVIAGGMHVAQNVAAKKLLKQPLVHKQLLSRFTNSARNLAERNTSGETIMGLSRGIVPEMGMINNEATHLGKNYGRKIVDGVKQQLGGRVPQLSSEDRGHLGNILKGKLNPVVEAKGLTNKYVQFALKNNASPIPKELRTPLNNALASPQREQILKEVEGIWGKYDTTKHLASGIGDQLVKGKLPSNITANTGTAIQATGDVLGTAATYVADPIAFGVNQTKRLLSSDLSKHKRLRPLQRGQQFLNRKFVREPVVKMFRKGSEGKKILFRKQRKFLDTYAFNPLTADAKNLAYDFGRLSHKYKLSTAVSPETLAAAKKVVHRATEKKSILDRVKELGQPTLRKP